MLPCCPLFGLCLFLLLEGGLTHMIVMHFHVLLALLPSWEQLAPLRVSLSVQHDQHGNQEAHWGLARYAGSCAHFPLQPGQAAAAFASAALHCPVVL